MSYEFYKIIHVGLAFIIVSNLSLIFVQKNQSKKLKIFAHTCALLLMVAGMGLIARIGIGHGESWPVWIKMKLGIWILLAVLAPIAAKKGMRSTKTFVGFLGLMIIAVIIAVLKPS